jgi:hypothetical protein
VRLARTTTAAVPTESSAIVRRLRSGVSLVFQKGLMRILCRPGVDAEVVPARRIEPFVPEQLLDMPIGQPLNRSVVATVCRRT